MPRLPSAQDYPGSAPSPTRGMTQVGAVRETADLATGRVISGIGEMMQLEAEKLDETVALDALNQLQNKQLDLTYGENGFTKLQGKGVIDGKITSEYPAQLKAEAERLRATIKSTGGQSKFDQRASAVVRGFTQNTYQHAAKETETYHASTESARVTTQAQAANLAAMAGDVEGVALAVKAGRDSVEAAITRRGYDKAQADDYRQKELGVIHSDVINGLLDSSQPALAAAWLKSSRKEMTTGQADKFDARVKTDLAWAEGDTFVREQMAAGKSAAEVEAALAADAKKTGDKTKYDAGLHTLGTLNTLRTKTYAENADKAQDEINRGTPWGKVRAKYLDTMDPSVVASFDARADAAAKDGAVKTDFETYYSLSSMKPEDLAKVDLRTVSHKLSPGDQKHFADLQYKINNKETPDAVKLTAQLSAAHNEMGWGNKPADRKKKGMFNQYVNESVIAEEARTGKKMNDDERERLIKKALITKEGGWFSSDQQFYQVPEARRADWIMALGPEERKQLGSVLAVRDVPTADRAAITASYKKRGLASPTESQILDAYRAKRNLK